MYAKFLGTSATIDALFLRLHGAVLREVRVGKELLGLQGALDLLMAAATTGDAPDMSPTLAAVAGGGDGGGGGAAAGMPDLALWR